MRYFQPEEFDCKCSKCRTNNEGRGAEMMDDYFLQMLDDARHKAGVPFRITSGYRCIAHNRAVGGVKDSAHTKGLAADIACSDSRTRGYIIGALFDLVFATQQPLLKLAVVGIAVLGNITVIQRVLHVRGQLKIRMEKEQ